MPERDVRDYLVAYCTCPPEEAPGIARALVEGAACACVSIVPGLRSVYTWKGEVADEAESLLVIKTRADRFEALERAVRKVHPYEVFELVACRVERGSAAYLEWIDSCVQEPPGGVGK